MIHFHSRRCNHSLTSKSEHSNCDRQYSCMVKGTIKFINFKILFHLSRMVRFSTIGGEPQRKGRIIHLPNLTRSVVHACMLHLSLCSCLDLIPIHSSCVAPSSAVSLHTFYWTTSVNESTLTSMSPDPHPSNIPLQAYMPWSITHSKVFTWACLPWVC